MAAHLLQGERLTPALPLSARRRKRCSEVRHVPRGLSTKQPPAAEGPSLLPWAHQPGPLSIISLSVLLETDSAAEDDISPWEWGRRSLHRGPPDVSLACALASHYSPKPLFQLWPDCVQPLRTPVFRPPFKRKRSTVGLFDLRMRTQTVRIALGGDSRKSIDRGIFMLLTLSMVVSTGHSSTGKVDAGGLEVQSHP